MPNWVKNEITVTAHNEKGRQEMKKFQELFNEKGRFDFNKIIPMPESLDIVAGSDTVPAMAWAYHKRNVLKELDTSGAPYTKEQFKTADCSILSITMEDMRSVTFQPADRSVLSITMEAMQSAISRHDKLPRLPEGTTLPEDIFSASADRSTHENYYELVHSQEFFEGLGERALANIILHGYISWYEWCIHNWDTKWNVNHDSTISVDQDDNGETELSITFETAWSLPEAVLRKMVEMFPNLAFDGRYADEDLGSNCGEWEGRNGKFSLDADSRSEDAAFDFACDVWGFDPEEERAAREDLDD